MPPKVLEAIFPDISRKLITESTPLRISAVKFLVGFLQRYLKDFLQVVVRRFYQGLFQIFFPEFPHVVF